jgi:hypothetical protein
MRRVDVEQTKAPSEPSERYELIYETRIICMSVNTFLGGRARQSGPPHQFQNAKNDFAFMRNQVF